MKIEQIYTGCLAQGAYFIESAGEAAVIDPLREVTPYLKRAEKDGATIKYVFETHFHADFVSGHLDLAQKTGATIVYGPNAQTGFAAHIAHDGEEFRVGEVTIRALHTPGHTLESTCYLLLDENGKPTALFSGDTLFIGDVGRPDLAQKTDLTMNDLAGYLYDSLRNKIMTLPDDLIVYPAHGAGSACGKNMSKETSDTLGNQKKFNYALRAGLTKEDFIREVTDGLLAPPKYFPQNVRLNKEGYDSFDEVLERGAQALSPEEFEAGANETGALVLDTRAARDFAQGFIPNSINIGIDGSFAPWVGALVPDLEQPLLLVTEPGREEEVITRLARVGYDFTLGYLAGGFEAWQQAGKEVDSLPSISASTFAQKYQTGLDGVVVDVRKPGEFEAEHVEGAINLPLDFISEQMAEYSRRGTLYLHCAGGYRSMIAASILKARGFEQIVDVAGGFGAIAQTEVPRTNFVCPTTLQKS
ncbi:MBL fold metallo-hydrolase [Rhabdobacter roseus]|uniref:Glyoxylase-like metal-dependent hydrolase (Beta-lactamase superfamily II)/rhodanese-related sulfurtransferase n=1 Tax=Rhabdobacter roseus TaxID=1655419 RepID=A0A840TWT0_9BACT|nr:MBL fold metallo-hydrolase [Rhabdobacter roseus]MBB5284400.1 glyoxylase-like metal-dependent hydrolase (beta-lactamase superfamily II)/rhodanese-related sulfurtransferase [Rhabdobacter roseus]